MYIERKRLKREYEVVNDKVLDTFLVPAWVARTDCEACGFPYDEQYVRAIRVEGNTLFMHNDCSTKVIKYE